MFLIRLVFVFSKIHSFAFLKILFLIVFSSYWNIASDMILFQARNQEFFVAGEFLVIRSPW